MENKANAVGTLETPRVYWQIVSFKRAHHITTRYHTKTNPGPLFEVVQETQDDRRNTNEVCSNASRTFFEPRSLARDWKCHLFRCCNMAAHCVATKGTTSIYNVSVLTRGSNIIGWRQENWPGQAPGIVFVLFCFAGPLVWCDETPDRFTRSRTRRDLQHRNTLPYDNNFSY